MSEWLDAHWAPTLDAFKAFADQTHDQETEK